MNEKEFEKIRRKFHKAKYEMDRIKDEKLKEQNKTFIGKCFKFRNSYGGDNRWWLYIKVVGVEDTYLITESYEITSHKRVEIQQKSHGVYGLGRQMEDYEPITNKQFEIARKRIIKKLKYGDFKMKLCSYVAHIGLSLDSINQPLLLRSGQTPKIMYNIGVNI